MGHVANQRDQEALTIEFPMEPSQPSTSISCRTHTEKEQKTSSTSKNSEEMPLIGVGRLKCQISPQTNFFKYFQILDLQNRFV